MLNGQKHDIKKQSSFSNGKTVVTNNSSNNVSPAESALLEQYKKELEVINSTPGLLESEKQQEIEELKIKYKALIAKQQKAQSTATSVTRKDTSKEEEYQKLLREIYNNYMEQNYQAAGAGSLDHLYGKVCTRFDRFNKRYYTPNTVYSGYTFITRPRLKLDTQNLHASRYLQLFNNEEPDNINFAIRCMLDTVYSNPYFIKNHPNRQYLPTGIFKSPYFDPYNPFLSLLSNTLEDMSGFPSQTIRDWTSEGGYFSESIRYAAGSDRYGQPFNLSLSFLDIEGGIVQALFKLWMDYIDLVTTGEVVAYMDDIEQRRLNYTVSIYRFLVDPTNRYIVNAAKCTGCFPIDRPSGARFDISRAERFVEASKKFTINFVCNHFDEDDPIILYEFNTLMNRYNPGISNLGLSKVSTEDSAGNVTTKTEEWRVVPFGLEYNYIGLPYINIKNTHRPILEFRYKPAQQQNKTTYNSVGQLDTELTELEQKYVNKNSKKLFSIT